MIPSHIPLSPLGGYRMLQKHYTTLHTNEKYHHLRISNCLIRRGVQGLAFSGFRLDGQLDIEFPLHFPDREIEARYFHCNCQSLHLTHHYV
jgi:hypothetical protein